MEDASIVCDGKVGGTGWKGGGCDARDAGATLLLLLETAAGLFLDPWRLSAVMVGVEISFCEFVCRPNRMQI